MPFRTQSQAGLFWPVCGRSSHHDCLILDLFLKNILRNKDYLQKLVNILCFRVCYFAHETLDWHKSTSMNKMHIFFHCYKILMKCSIEVEISLIIWFTEKGDRGKWVPWLMPWCTILRLKILLMYSAVMQLKVERESWMDPLI